MKSIRKSILILSFALILLFSMACAESAETKHVIDNAKIVSYESADDVIAASALIVEVKKLSEEPLSFPLENDKTDDFTLSTVEIIKVIKPMPGKNFSIGDKIPVLESEWFDAKMGIVHHTEGYVKMQSDKVYTLCLGYNDMGENSQFYPIGLLYGKIPHDESEARIFGEALDPQIERVQADLIATFDAQ